MRVAIAGGRSRTDYLVESLLEAGNEVVVINADRRWCERFASRHDVPVICGDATSTVFMFIVGNVDADNLVICQMARYYFNVRRQICTAYNPRNVPIFKKLGVSTVISATYIMSKLIEDGPDIEGNAVFHV